MNKHSRRLLQLAAGLAIIGIFPSCEKKAYKLQNSRLKEFTIQPSVAGSLSYHPDGRLAAVVYKNGEIISYTYEREKVMKFFSRSGILTDKTEYIMNQHGLATEQVNYNSGGVKWTWKESIYFKYNEDGQMISASSPNLRIVYNWADGDLQSELQYGPEQTDKLEYSYDNSKEVPDYISLTNVYPEPFLGKASKHYRTGLNRYRLINNFWDLKAYEQYGYDVDAYGRPMSIFANSSRTISFKAYESKP